MQVLRDDHRAGRIIMCLSGIGHDHREIGEDYCAGDEDPPGPTGNDDRSQDAGGADPHRDEVLTGPAALLIGQGPLSPGDRMHGPVALCGARTPGTGHDPTVGPPEALRRSRSGRRASLCQTRVMASRTYGLTEFVGTSPEGIDAAIRNAITRAAQGTRHVDWFEVIGIRGYVRDGGVDHFQVTVKVGFRLEDVDASA